jgi:hypothetical protein
MTIGNTAGGLSLGMESSYFVYLPELEIDGFYTN